MAASNETPNIIAQQNTATAVAQIPETAYVLIWVPSGVGTLQDGLLKTLVPTFRQVMGNQGPLATLVLSSPGASENGGGFYTKSGFTLSEIRSVVVGSSTPSVTFSIRFGGDRSASGTEVVTGGIVCTNTTTGVATTSFTTATIPANSWVWITTTAQSGTVSSLSANLFA